MTGPVRKAVRRPSPLSVRLSPEERAFLERRAGNRPLSSYVKAVLLGGETPRSRDARTQTDHAMLARVLAALGKSQLSASLERLARAAQKQGKTVQNQGIQQNAQDCSTARPGRGGLGLV